MRICETIFPSSLSKFALWQVCIHGLKFYRMLQRIAIRLHIVLRVGQVKRSVAAHTVSACLVLEEDRLAEAGKTIIVSGLLLKVPLTNMFHRLSSPYKPSMS